MKNWVLGISLLASLAQGAFLSNQSEAYRTAKKLRKPMLISFYGIWCPPCNELKETVFPSPVFQEKAKKFVLLQVDADAQSSWALKHRYSIGGYPTVVFTDSKGEEIYRVVGYRTAAELARVMESVLNAKAKDFKTACQSEKVDDLWRCALVCQERKDKACTESAYAKLQNVAVKGTAIYDEVRTYFADNAANEDLKRLAYEKLLSEIPDSPKSLYWALSYVDLPRLPGAPPLRRDLAEGVLDQFEKIKKDSRQEALGIPLTDMLQVRAQLLGELGRVEESKLAWKEAADALQSKIEEHHGGSRGYSLERMGALEASGELEQALSLANLFRKQYPEEFTFHYRAASLLEGLKKPSEAIRAADQAFKKAYGDNKVRVATLLVRLYLQVPDQAKAKQVYEETIKEVTPDAALDVRTHRYLKKLQEAWGGSQAS